jgi:hypothetical protein
MKTLELSKNLKFIIYVVCMRFGKPNTFTIYLLSLYVIVPYIFETVIVGNSKLFGNVLKSTRVLYMSGLSYIEMFFKNQ